MLTETPRADVPALILADAIIAQGFGWDPLVPLLAAGLKRADLRRHGDDLRLACHRALISSAIEAVRQAADLTRRAAHLKAVAPKLRAKGAGNAVEMFLTRDAVAPSALPLPDRAARRLCERARHVPALRSVAMAKDRSEMDRELSDLLPELRWREWMRRIEAVLFASALPVPREDLARVVGQAASVDLLVADLAADLEGRAFEIAKVAGGWMFRTRAAYTPAIRAAADVEDQLLDLSEFDVAVLAAIAYHQPITRDGLKNLFGKEISRDMIGRLHTHGLIGTGPRSPRPGAPYTYVTTDRFLVAFDLESLQDLPDREQLEDAGIGVQ